MDNGSEFNDHIARVSDWTLFVEDSIWGQQWIPELQETVKHDLCGRPPVGWRILQLQMSAEFFLNSVSKTFCSRLLLLIVSITLRALSRTSRASMFFDLVGSNDAPKCIDES